MEIFLVTAPGLEHHLAAEATGLGLNVTDCSPGGVTLNGTQKDVVIANMHLRGAVRVLVRLTSFRAMHLAQLDKRARKLPWADWLRADVPLKVDAVCRKSRIYHHKAAAQRIEGALRDVLGVQIDKGAKLVLKVRIEDDLCTLSIDSSGEALHKRGIKQQVNKAPMRETMAALFLRACGYDGAGPVYDPMCGSGTFPIEAAEVASGLAPGRLRNFAFEQLVGYDPIIRPEMRTPSSGVHFFGTDRDSGAIAMSRANATRAGVQDICTFETRPISDMVPPTTDKGLVILNPPYGGRIGNKKPLYGLYAALGARLKDQFSGWRIGLITSEAALAKTTGLTWDTPGPIVDHGGTKIQLWQTQL